MRPTIRVAGQSGNNVRRAKPEERRRLQKGDHGADGNPYWKQVGQGLQSGVDALESGACRWYRQLGGGRPLGEITSIGNSGATDRQWREVRTYWVMRGSWEETCMEAATCWHGKRKRREGTTSAHSGGLMRATSGGWEARGRRGRNSAMRWSNAIRELGRSRDWRGAWHAARRDAERRGRPRQI
ncbi:hypothetical protein FGB62_14g11 [Gracilaria domingensis]|nr:hypothetical protein FGB62_14g11 [Gracilaria domingensis]